MIEVLKQALDALETEVSIDWTNNDEFNASAEKMHDAITSLRQAIREHALHEVQRLGQEIEQEPVAWRDRTYGTLMHQEWQDADPLYTNPPQLERNFCPRCGKRTNDIHTCTPPQRTWVGLTDEERNDLCYDFGEKSLWSFADSIEAKLKEKNT